MAHATGVGDCHAKSSDNLIWFDLISDQGNVTWGWSQDVTWLEFNLMWDQVGSDWFDVGQDQNELIWIDLNWSRLIWLDLTRTD